MKNVYSELSVQKLIDHNFISNDTLSIYASNWNGIDTISMKTNVIFQSNEYDLLLIITNILNTISNRYERKNSEQLFDRMRSRGCAYINFDTRN